MYADKFDVNDDTYSVFVETIGWIYQKFKGRLKGPTS